jgi:hypothetical protein
VDDVLDDFVLWELKLRFQPHQTPAEIIHNDQLGRPPIFCCNEAYGNGVAHSSVLLYLACPYMIG